ncbi:hypothetical protein V5O48_014840 [Marasmius crinis-equi]|uniref:Uncharacterized protein n=1 Tax=Marasmius crinis-equi TaxID=585013 RepID=A0ABR3EW55_9AGAR
MSSTVATDGYSSAGNSPVDVTASLAVVGPISAGPPAALIDFNEALLTSPINVLAGHCWVGYSIFPARHLLEAQSVRDRAVTYLYNMVTRNQGLLEDYCREAESTKCAFEEATVVVERNAKAMEELRVHLSDMEAENSTLQARIFSAEQAIEHKNLLMRNAHVTISRLAAFGVQLSRASIVNILPDVEDVICHIIFTMGAAGDDLRDCHGHIPEPLCESLEWVVELNRFLGQAKKMSEELSGAVPRDFLCWIPTNVEMPLLREQMVSSNAMPQRPIAPFRILSNSFVTPALPEYQDANLDGPETIDVDADEDGDEFIYPAPEKKRVQFSPWIVVH